jgi:hypothetical protein
MRRWRILSASAFRSFLEINQNACRHHVPKLTGMHGDIFNHHRACSPSFLADSLLPNGPSNSLSVAELSYLQRFDSHSPSVAASEDVP